VVKLATKRKHLTGIIKMIAYQAESDLLALPPRIELAFPGSSAERSTATGVAAAP
jgi:hypothetical protein